ncbi:MAG: sigma-70 family RNA polymerase sigma factor [Rhizobacter sp.]
MELDNAQVLALLKRVADRDEKAFVRLYESVSRRVYAFAMHKLSDATVASEIVSETLYQVWRAPAAFRGDAKFSTWVLGIARHKLLDRLRGSAPAHEDIDDYADQLAGNAPDGFATLSEQQRRDGVGACLDKLVDPHRECLYLVFYEGLALAEIAELQAVPEGTVKTRLFHARTKIKKCLQLLLVRERAAP